MTRDISDRTVWEGCVQCLIVVMSEPVEHRVFKERAEEVGECPVNMVITGTTLA